MKTNLSKTVAILGASLLALSASAIPERLDTVPYAPPGDIDPANAGDGVVRTWVQSLVTVYNAKPGPNAALPAVGVTAVDGSNNSVDPDGAGPLPGFGAGVLSLSIPVNAYDYIALRWGGPQGTDNWQAFYIGKEAGSYTFNAPVSTAGSQYGLSDYRLYNPHTNVPDGGTTIAMLGSALVGCSALSRKLRKA